MFSSHPPSTINNKRVYTWCYKKDVIVAYIIDRSSNGKFIKSSRRSKFRKIMNLHYLKKIEVCL